MEKYKILNDGNKMPVIGFGVFQITDLAECENTVLTALKTGYRLIDTAQSYYNEEAVGNALSKTEVKREDIFLTTKIWIENYGYEKTISSIEISLKKLKTNYLDLVLIHQPFGDVYESYRALADLKKQGKIKSIGVSNFYPVNIADISLFHESKIIPAVNQIEVNPFNQRNADITVNNKYGVLTQAWAPFAEGKNNIFKNEILESIAKKHNKSVAQVILRWLLEKNITFVVKSVNEKRIIENIDIFNFELDEDDTKNINKLNNEKSMFFDHTSPEGAELIKFLLEKRRK